MIIVLKPEASEREVDHIIDRLRELGLKSQLSTGQERTIIGVIGDDRILHNQPLTALPGVESVLPILAPWKLVSREFKREGTVIDVSGVKIGGNKLVIMAGPCAVERLEITVGIAHEVKAAGASILRGGAYKPRTSPYSFQGLGREGLDYLVEAKKQTGLPVVSEILDTRDIELFLEKADIIQIGARNMQNFELLKEVGAYDKPVLLKRGLSATIKEFLLSAEYIMSRGNQNVMLCERGIRTFETQYRNTLDLAAVPTLKELSHLPVIVDPSHATGKWNLVAPMSKAAVAAGADGILIEVHSNPECALCDGEESIKPSQVQGIDAGHAKDCGGGRSGTVIRRIVFEGLRIEARPRSGLKNGAAFHPGHDYRSRADRRITRHDSPSKEVGGKGHRSWAACRKLENCGRAGRDRSLCRRPQRRSEGCRPGRVGHASRHL